MISNADVTLYHWASNAYVRIPIYRVFIDYVKASNVAKSGNRDVDSAKVFIQADSVSNFDIEPSKDLLVQGITDFEFDNTSQATQSNSLKELRATTKVLTVMSCDAKLYGITSLRHYMLSCK